MKISDKLSKVNENCTINRYDNGFMFECYGRVDKENGDWDGKAVKIMVTTVEDLTKLIQEFASMEIND